MSSWTARLRWASAGKAGATDGGMAPPKLLRQDSSGAEAISDKIVLPPSAIAQLAAIPSATFPLLFELTSTQTSTRTCCGVLEFTATEGTMVLPKKVRDSLNLTEDKEGGEIVVRHSELPKATYIALQPLTADFLDIPDHKSLLQAAVVKSLTCMNKGDIIGLRFGGVNYDVAVSDVKPASRYNAVCMVNTDVAVTLLAPLNLGERDGRQPTAALKLGGEVVSSTVGAGAYKYYKFSVPQTTDMAANDVVVDVKAIGGDPDVYVSAHPVIHPTMGTNSWCGTARGDTQVIIRESDEGFKFGWFYLGVTGFEEEATFQVAVRLADHTASKLEGSSTSSGSETPKEELPEGMVRCGNCGDAVPAMRLVMHSAFCERHNTKCPVEGCGAVLHASEREKHWHCPNCSDVMHQDDGRKHIALYHTALPCRCGESLELLPMRRHKAADCRLRQVQCRFCGNVLSAGPPPSDRVDQIAGLTGHEAYCGNRTTLCTKCGAAVPLKRVALHNRAHDSGVIPLRPELGSAVAAADAAAAAAAEAAAEASEPHPTLGAGGAGGAGAGAGAGWDCPACTLHNEPGSTVCDTCGSANPSAPKPAPVATAPTLPVGAVPGVGTGGAPSWACPSCTFANAPGSTVCSMCGHNTRPQAGSRGRAGAAVAPPPLPPAATLCRNTACSYHASKKGEAAELGLCSRCYGTIIKPHDDEAAVLKALVARYFSQLTAGCEFGSACRNKECRNGAPEGHLPTDNNNALAMRAMHLAKEGTKATAPRFYWCTGGAAALASTAPAAPAEASSAAKAVSAGDSAGAGAGDLTDDAVVAAGAEMGLDVSDVVDVVAERERAEAAKKAAAAARRERARKRKAERAARAKRDAEAKSRVAGAFFG